MRCGCFVDSDMLYTAELSSATLAAGTYESRAPWKVHAAIPVYSRGSTPTQGLLDLEAMKTIHAALGISVKRRNSYPR